MTILPVRAEFFHGTTRRTERRSDSGTKMTQLITTFRDFVKPPIPYIHHVQRTGLFGSFQIWTTCTQTLTHHLQVADLTLHGICVDLAHVPATVWLLYIPDLKVPCSVIAMRNTNAMIFSDHVCCYSKNCLCIDSKPSHLQKKKRNILSLLCNISWVMTANAICSRVAYSTAITNYEYGQTCMKPTQIISLYCNGNKLLDSTIILVYVPCIFHYFVLWPTNAQLSHRCDNLWNNCAFVGHSTK